jgi:hypothetical protein
MEIVQNLNLHGVYLTFKNKEARFNSQAVKMHH